MPTVWKEQFFPEETCSCRWPKSWKKLWVAWVGVSCCKSHGGGVWNRLPCSGWGGWSQPHGQESADHSRVFERVKVGIMSNHNSLRSIRDELPDFSYNQIRFVLACLIQELDFWRAKKVVHAVLPVARHTCLAHATKEFIPVIGKVSITASDARNLDRTLI